MSIGDRIRALFAQTPPETSVSGEVGWSETLIYQGSSFPKYNPDDVLSRKGFGIYRKMMTDEQIKAVVRFKRDAITSRDWYFECDHDDLSDDEKKSRKDFFCKILNGTKGSWLDAMNGIMSAMYHGFSMSEKVYRVDDYEGSPRIVLDKLKLRPYDTFYFYTDSHGNILRIVQKLEGQEQDIDPAKMIHYVQNPDFDEHYGGSELRECYRAWFSKDITIRMQNIYLERMASGFIWVSPREGKSLSASSQEYIQLQAVLSNISTKTAMILPSGMELHVEHPASTDAYERAVAQHDKAIAKALLVPNLMGISEQGSTGSFAQSQTQLEAFLWTLDADATRLEEILNEQLFKEIGDLNYGDGYYPKFKFKPVSDAKKMEIVKTWQGLVQAGAVQVTETDEAHLRELLDIPAKPEIAEESQPEVSLNGAQVTSIIDIAAKVGKGELSQDAAKSILVAAFPLTDEQATRIVATEVSTPAPVPLPGQLPASPGGATPSEEQESPDDEEEMPEETVVGRDVLKSSKCNHSHGEPLTATKAAFSKAMKRVDFAVIGSKSDDSAEDSAYQVASVNGDAVARMVVDAESIGFDVDKVETIKYTAGELGAMKKAVMGGLSEGWKIGATHAQKELRKADKDKFGRAHFEVTDRALTDIAADYFKVRGHKITGSISSQTQATIQNTLLEGIKGSHAFADTKKEIYKALESEGLLTEEDVIEALGTKTVKNTKARIQTIMRTSTFEAINEARYQYFADPELAGFVEALEYSAILDDRTTEICSELNGKTYAVDSEEWRTYNPPNHYGCRSLLIPVTSRDTWEPSDPPTVMPQKGFGFDRAPYETSQGQVTVSPIINVQPPNVTLQLTMPEHRDQVVNFTAEVPNAPAPVIQNVAAEAKEKTVSLTLPDGRKITGTVK